ncbi:OTU domain-containing protein 4 isoform X1 [Pleurodeles waltl]
MEVTSGAGPETTGGGKEQLTREALMDQYLASQGLYRKKVAKDGSCLFRAVAEQVQHSQARHYDIRLACINYLRENRDAFEAFIEGPFEEYLQRLENPQEWVGQVEISALSLMYKKDFVIYQEPNAPPSCVTENHFPDKIMLCFSNGNHYDIVYPASYTENAALCQSILYEMLYERVLSTDVSKILLDPVDTDVAKEESIGSDEDSESDADDASRSKNAIVGNMNGFKTPSGNKIHGSGSPTYFFLPRKVLRSLNPALYRNLEYDVWLKLKREQQRRDFSIAAGMQYSVGDKCKVRLETGGKLYDAHIQEVSSENGPVVVFVEEFGKKFDVSLKSLKPLPQAAPLTTTKEGWNTVPGKKLKRVPITSSAHFQTDGDYRGQKIAGKPGKPQSTLPPRLQQASGNRQQHYGPSPGPASQHTSSEQRTQSRTPAQAAGRKLERERSEEFESSSKACSYFGLSPDERRERQAIEESKSLYEIQNLDEEAFPALSSQTTTHSGEVYNQRKQQNANNEKSPKQKVDSEEPKELNHKMNLSDQSPQRSTEERPEECTQTSADDATSSCDTSAPAETPPDLPVLPVVPPVVPILPDAVPPWPNESTTYNATGISTQMSVPAVSAPSSEPDPALVQEQGPSVQFSPLPVPLQAVNHPVMPLPPTLNLYQDPLYPGFPLDENGERATAPSYSLCKGGEDLPRDKSILQFFFNLGLKAYSCPMWAPHSYLYPLHQAYLNMCRMYPKIPVYPHNTWYPEVASAENEHVTHVNRQSPMQHDTRINGQCAQGGAATPPPPPWIFSAVQVPGNPGQVPNLCQIETENVIQPPQAIYTESAANKSVYPQPPLGHSSFLGPVPLAHSFFPPVWYGYPMQGFIESPTVQHNLTSAVAESDLNKEFSSSVLTQRCREQFQDNAKEHSTSVQHTPVTRASSEHPSKGTNRVDKEEQMCTAAAVPQKKATLQDLSGEAKEAKRRSLVSSPLLTGGESQELTNATVLLSEKTDPKAPVSLPDVLPQTRPHRTREESSEDEREVSDMLKSGRSKNFYNQTYGARKYRNDRGYAFNRGGFHYPRNEEGWKGPGSRREDGYQPHRSFRGRPYKSDNRRRPVGDPYRGHQEYDSQSPYPKLN